MNLYQLGKSYEPAQGLQQQFFTYPTALYAAQVGPIADNVFDTAIQGVDYKAWYDFTPVKIRSFPASTSSTGELMPDDWQKIYIIQPVGLSYLSPGAYLFYNNNWWIVFKPENLSVGIGQAVVRRCNANINTLDYYGNIVTVPMSYAKMGTLGNASHASENSIVAKNYISCVCQYNKTSAVFDENTRLILGNVAYAMRGVNNFTREYTDDPDSVHVMSFTIERTETLPSDDLVNQVADGKAFSWEIQLDALDMMNLNSNQSISVKSIRNGLEVASTTENPIGYIFSSSDETVLKTSSDGLVTAVGEGSAIINVQLEQNPSISAAVEIVVSAIADGLSFTQIADEIREQKSAEISAAWVENGVETDEKVLFEFSGAPEMNYEASEIAPNTYRITCYLVSATPLLVSIHCQGETKQINIRLRG